jgi:hypothetical protein
MVMPGSVDGSGALADNSDQTVASGSSKTCWFNHSLISPF